MTAQADTAEGALAVLVENAYEGLVDRVKDGLASGTHVWVMDPQVANVWGLFEAGTEASNRPLLVVYTAEGDFEGADLGDPAWGPDEEEPAICGADYSTGGPDPYGSTCDLEPGHKGEHSGPDPFGEGRMAWSGGGWCAGDPLPVRNVRFSA